MPTPTPKSITPEEFDALLARYPSLLPSKLELLDTQRYTVIPGDLSHRTPKYLEQEEALTLVDWKLSHGTFRPRLKALAASNADIERVTRNAFRLIPPDGAEVGTAMRTLISLKGVGPATASLFLAVAEPSVPFFSDELFLWTHGWERKIGYTVKEYEGLIGEVRAVAKRLDRKVVEVEKVAWVIGKLRGGKKGWAKGEMQADEEGEKKAEVRKVKTESEEVERRGKRKVDVAPEHEGRRTRSARKK